MFMFTGTHIRYVNRYTYVSVEACVWDCVGVYTCRHIKELCATVVLISPSYRYICDISNTSAVTVRSYISGQQPTESAVHWSVSSMHVHVSSYSCTLPSLDLSVHLVYSLRNSDKASAPQKHLW